MAETNAIQKSELREIRPEESSGRGRENNPISDNRGWSYLPAADVIEHGDRLEIVLDVPGVRLDQIEVSTENNALSIQARPMERYPESMNFLRQEYGVGTYHRRFRLDNSRFDTQGVSASLENGVLNIVVPKRPEAQRRVIQVRAGA